MPFINGELDINQLEEFVNHLKSCPDCMEELEVYYVLVSGMKQLDEDKVLSNNFHHDLMNLLKRSEDRIFHNKVVHIRKRIILIIVITLAAMASSFRIGELVVEDVINDSKKSDFMVDNVFFRYKNDKFQNMIEKNLSDIYVFLYEKDPEGAKKLEEHYGKDIWKGESFPDGVGLKHKVVPK
jgi:hypothetical protein